MSNELEVKSIIENIINPASGNTLNSEKRINEISLDASSVVITYDREGINPEQKKSIENQMRQGLLALYLADDITLKTTSKKSEDVFESQEGSCDSGSCGCSSSDGDKKASLQAGHSGMPEKRRVVGAKKLFAISSAL